METCLEEERKKLFSGHFLFFAQFSPLDLRLLAFFLRLHYWQKSFYALKDLGKATHNSPTLQRLFSPKKSCCLGFLTTFFKHIRLSKHLWFVSHKTMNPKSLGFLLQKYIILIKQVVGGHLW